MSSANYPNASDTFYFNLISRDLRKVSYCASLSLVSPKLTILNNLNRSHYWFPANSGSRINKAKLLKLRYKPVYSSFSAVSPIFLDLLKLYMKSIYDVNIEVFLESSNFNTVLSLLNETCRRQSLKKTLPVVREGKFNTWFRPRPYSRNLYLNYFTDFSPHRTISKFRKFNFLSINAWWFENKWLFGFLKMQDRFLRGWPVEHFKWRFLRFPGMSYSFWAKEQLKFNYYNYNSFDLTADTYYSKAFVQQYPPPSSSEFQLTLKFFNDKILTFSLFYWFLKNSSLQINTSQASYFSASYATYRYTYGASRLHLKNHYASLTPKFAHAYFAKFRRRNFLNVYDKFHWYIHLAEPAYWNLRNGLNMHPHEFWTWEEVSWWEDNVTFNFFRFKKNRRQARFYTKEKKNALDYYNLDSVWLYKTWFHEHIFLELISSYFKSYINFQYLSPYSRFSSDYPAKKFGHFDPKWQDRLFEYTYHAHPDYFFPSTDIFYENYSSSVVEDDLESFLMLNFAWKLNKDGLFFPLKKRFLPKFVRSTSQLLEPLNNFAPKFEAAAFNIDSVFPLLIDSRTVFIKQLDAFESCLVFLMNFFYRSNFLVVTNFNFINFLYSYLIYSGLVTTDKTKFLEYFKNFEGKTYIDLSNFLSVHLGLLDEDYLFHKERIVVEYTAFKRWYTLLVSEYTNNK